MKKFVVLLIVLMLTLSLTACGSSVDKISSDSSLPSDSQAGSKIEPNTTAVNNSSEISQENTSQPLSQQDPTIESNNTLHIEDESIYTSPTITASKTNLKLNNTSSVVYITVSDDCTIEYDISDTNIVNCEWGDWDGYTVPLTFNPISSGETYVTVSLEGYNKKITIYVDVNMHTPSDLTTLAIEGVGKEFDQYTTGLPNTNKLHSATYRIDNYVNDTVAIWVDYIVSCTDCVNYTGYIELRYNLYNSSGVVVKTGTAITEFTHTYTQYAGTLVFSDLPTDNYKLVFSSKY